LVLSLFFGNGSDVLLGENQAEVCIGLQHKVIDKNQNKYKIEYEKVKYLLFWGKMRYDE